MTAQVLLYIPDVIQQPIEIADTPKAAYGKAIATAHTQHATRRSHSNRVAVSSAQTFSRLLFHAWVCFRTRSQTVVVAFKALLWHIPQAARNLCLTSSNLKPKAVS